MSTGILTQAEKPLRGNRFIGLVVSSRMLQEDWPSLEKMIADLLGLGSAEGQLVAILKDNVTLPPVLRLQEWIDFRPGHSFEQGIRDLLAMLGKDIASFVNDTRWMAGNGLWLSKESAWISRPLFASTKKSGERIVPNLFPVVEIPKEIFSAESRFQTESEVMEACSGSGQLPYLLKSERLYAVEPLTSISVFAKAKKQTISDWIRNTLEAALHA